MVLTTTGIRAAGTPTLRNLADRFADTLNVKDFGALGDGQADDTAAIQLAISSLKFGGGEIWLPAGIYRTTSTIAISNDRVNFRGAGRHATQSEFDPTSDGTCFKFAKKASILFECSIRDLSFYSTDAHYSKVALEIVDTSSMIVHNIAISGGIRVGQTYYWSGGGGSRGILVRGREAGTMSNISSTSDKPLVVGDQPNHTIDIDHFNFHNLYLIANGHPCITVLNGVNLTQVSFTGYQAWVCGTHGFYWVDTATTFVSTGLHFENVRTEQGTDRNAFMFYISHNYGLQNLTISGAHGGVDRNGIFLRKVSRAHFLDGSYAGPNGVALDAVALPGYLIKFTNFFLQTGSKATLTNYRQQSASWKPNTYQPIPYDAMFVYASNTLTDFQLEGNAYSMSFTGVIDPGGSFDLQCGLASISIVTVAAYGSSADEGGTVMITPSAVRFLNRTSNFGDSEGGNKLVVQRSQGRVILSNNLGQRITYLATIKAAR